MEPIKHRENVNKCEKPRNEYTQKRKRKKKKKKRKLYLYKTMYHSNKYRSRRVLALENARSQSANLQ